MSVWCVLSKWVPHVLLVSPACLVFVWIYSYDQELGGGLGSSKAALFNWHPFLMTLGFFFFSGEALVHFALHRSEHWVKKIVHSFLHFGGIICTTCGLYAVIQFHNSMNIPNFYSLHSWLGICVYVLYIGQFIMGGIVFYGDKVSGKEPSESMSAFKRQFKKQHVFFGLAIFIGAVCVSLLGLLEKQTFLQKDKKTAQFSSESMMANSIGMVIAIMCVYTIYLYQGAKDRKLSQSETPLLRDSTRTHRSFSSADQLTV
eukprot:Nk52_evm38s78 gene=Nk52_evmTU38s78